MMKVAILTVSDRGSRGERIDRSGQVLLEWLEKHDSEVVSTAIVPDEIPQIANFLIEWSDKDNLDVILTTGGTGVSPRDVTPDATEKVIERVLPGFGELMRRKGLEKTPTAIISRGVAGVRKDTLIINLPGSPIAALENLSSIWAAVPHTVEKIQGDARDCGRDVG